MGRRKKREVPALPSSPVRLVDALLYAEDEIKKTVKEERFALSLIGASNQTGGGRGRSHSDRTATAAVKLADGLPCIVLDDGRTIKKPEKWLACFEAVRKQAEKCNRPNWIYEAWAAKYDEKTRFIDAEITAKIFNNIVDWIRYNVLTEARKADLVAFEDEEVIKDIEEYEEPFFY